MGKLLILMGMLLVAGLAAMDRGAARKPASLGKWNPEEDGRQQAVSRALAWDDRVAYRAEYAFEGRQAELLLQLRRDRSDNGLGATARVLELRRLSYGHFLERPVACVNALWGPMSANGELRLERTRPSRYDERPNSDLVVGFPLRNEHSMGGTLASWNVVTARHEPVGTVRWTRLTHAQETQLENRIVKEWREAPGYLRSKPEGGCDDAGFSLVSRR